MAVLIVFCSCWKITIELILIFFTAFNRFIHLRKGRSKFVVQHIGDYLILIYNYRDRSRSKSLGANAKFQSSILV